MIDSQGPNYVWHLDGYDKLTPYGFPNHACIDGQVHVVIFVGLNDGHVHLHTDTQEGYYGCVQQQTNKDTKVILLYYLLTVFTIQGIVNNLQLSNVTII